MRWNRSWPPDWAKWAGVTELVEHDEVHAAEIVGQPPWRPARVSASSLLTRSTTLKKRPRAPAWIMRAGDGDGQMGLAGLGVADQHGIALMGEEVAGGEVAYQGLVDRGVVEHEVVDVLGERQLGDGDLVLDRASLASR